MTDLLWVAQTSNRKTGSIPTAYVGRTQEETRASCEGCPLLAGECYAWYGLTASWGLKRVQRLAAERPGNYTIETALKKRHGRRGDTPGAAKAIRIAALGDPARADRGQLLHAIQLARAAGLAVLAYSHHWRRPEGRGLEGQLMASTDFVPEADEALKAGWRPTTILPYDHEGATFTTPGGAKGVVCPAQRKDAVTCNTCRMCDPQAAVWKAGKVQVIGFVEHSRAALRAARREGRKLPSAGMGAIWNGTKSKASKEDKRQAQFFAEERA